MQLFYTNNIKGSTAILGEVETRHCTKVLRKNVGDIINFIDGNGGLHKGKITDFSKKDCWLNILESKQLKKWNHHIHIAIAPTKNISRTEWFLEKCTEIGIDEITFLLCDHSERKKIRLDRLEKILLSATKQSLKAHLPKLNDLTSCKDFIKGVKDNYSKKYVCWVNEENVHYLKNSKAKEDVIILIGPEGDFSQNEIELALQSNFIPVSLGDSRLRTETAGVVACHLVHIKNS